MIRAVTSQSFLESLGGIVEVDSTMEIFLERGVDFRAFDVVEGLADLLEVLFIPLVKQGRFTDLTLRNDSERLAGHNNLNLLVNTWWLTVLRLLLTGSTVEVPGDMAYAVGRLLCGSLIIYLS
jgi:hypothetical protein